MSNDGLLAGTNIELAMVLAADAIEKLTDDELAEIEKINAMSHEEMAWLWRFGSSGHPYFNRKKPYYPVFWARLESLGGMTSEMSKRIGWVK